MKEDTQKSLLLALKRHNPFKVRVFANDDDGRDIAVPTRRRKWASVIEAIEARPWVRCEMLDKAGAVLGYANNEAGGTELEDLTPVLGAGIGGQVMLAERIVAMVTRAQREVMTLRDKETQMLLTAQGDVVREMTTAVRGLAEVYREQTAASADAAEQRANAAIAVAQQADGDGVDQLLKNLPVLLQALPLLKAMLASGPTPPPINVPPNGHAKH